MAPIPELLRNSHVIAVVGLSNKRARPSYSVSEYMQKQGYRIIPVNVDIVDIFRRSELVAPVVESAIRIGAAAVWMQEGVVDQAAGRKAKAAGLAVVIDRCILKEHQRYLR